MTLLDITLTSGWAILVAIVILLIVWDLYTSNEKLKKEKNENLSKIKEQSLNFQKNEAELKLFYQNWAFQELERFKKLEIENIKIEAESQSLKAASVHLQEWKIENEAKIRQDAISRSYSVNLGKITEHLVPFHHSFLSQFNPKDARFIGSPIDLIVFDGYADKKDEMQIYLVEIKTGNSKLTEMQKKIKDTVLKGNIRWAEINPENNKDNLIVKREGAINMQEGLPSIDLNVDDNYKKLFAIVEAKEGESRDFLIDRIADAIEGIGILMDDHGYSLKAAIAKKIHDNQITFKTEADRIIFMNSITNYFG